MDNEIQIENKDLTEVPISPNTKGMDANEFRKQLAALEIETANQQPKPIEVYTPVELEQNQLVNEDTSETTLEAEPIISDNEPAEDEDLNSKTIPKKRLNKEIERRKALEEQLAKEREERIRAQTEIDLYNKAIQRLNGSGEAAKSEIDPIDPDTYQYTMKEINALKQELQDLKQQSEQSVKTNYFSNALNAQQAEFQKATPDFDQAYEYLKQKEIENTMLLGHSEEEAAQITFSKLAQTAQTALQNGMNVPQLLYKISQNVGYKQQNISKKGPNLAAINKNAPTSADATREIPSVSAKMGNPVSAPATMADFDRRLMNKDGRGVNGDDFQAMMKRLRQDIAAQS